MGSQLSGLRIAGIAVVLFSGILLGVGMHHLVATGTCSSTGYSANYGPVPTCPSGTGWWFAFVFGGIVGCLIGSAMASGVAYVFAGIFGGIGFGALSIALDSSASSATKLFGAIFGGCFAIVGVIAWISIIGGGLGSLRGSRARPKRVAAGSSAGGARGARGGSGGDATGLGASDAASAFGPPDASSAFGGVSAEADPILSAYQATHGAAGTTASPSPSVASSPGISAASSGGAPTPLNLIAGIQAARAAAAHGSVDELSRLADLHQRGALTDAEFASAKAKLLGEM